jgi:tetratricopeptide (TPR) repeat protein/transglutaminase-like putative cysteine protease
MAASAAIGQQAPLSAEPAGEDVVVEHVDTSYRCEDDGRGSLTLTMRVRILTPGGQAAFSQVYLYTIMPIERGTFDYVRTRKKNGRVLTADASAAVDVKQQQGGESLEGMAVKAVAPPSLEPGDTLEWRISKSWDAVAKGEFWLEHPRTTGVRIESETVTLDVPAGRALLLHHDPDLAPRIEEGKGRRTYRWSLDAQPATAAGRKKPLFALSTFHDWSEVGRWFLASQPTGDGQPAIRAKAQELTAGLQSQRDKTVAIHRWASRSIRYVGAPFASSGYRARPPAEVLRTGWGDCKDKHGLLAALLREVGIASAPVLVSTSGTLPFPEVPAPTQFDHVVTLVRLDGEDLWLDSTLDVARPGELLPVFRGTQGLAIEGGGAALVTVPDTQQPTTIAVTVSGTVTAAGVLDAQTSVEMSGDYEQTMRLLVRQTGGAGRKAFAEYMGGSQAPHATVSDPDGTDPLDLDQRFTVRYRLTHDTYLSGGGTPESAIPSLLLVFTRTGPVQASADATSQPAQAGEAAKPEPPAEIAARRTVPTEIREAVTLEYPEGAVIAAPMPVKVETLSGGYEATYEVKGSQLNVRRVFHVPGFGSAEEGDTKTASLRDLLKKDVAQNVSVRGIALPTPTTDIGSRSPEELIRSGTAALSAGRAGEAVDLLAAALKKKPDDGEALRSLATAGEAAARWEEAESALRRLLELDPLDQQAGMTLAMLMMKRQRYPESIAAFRKLVESNPYGAQAWTALGMLFRQTHRLDEATEAFRSAVKAEPGNPGPRMLLASALRQQGHTDEARRFYDEAMALPLMKQYAGPTPPFEADMIEGLAPMIGIGPGLVMTLPKTESTEGLLTHLGDRLAHLASLSAVDREYAAVGDLLSVAEDLVRLGRADLSAGRLAAARGRLVAAFELTLDTTVAADLADVDARLGRFDEAVRMWAVAPRGSGVAVPQALAAHLAKAGLKDPAFESQRYEVLERRSLPYPSPTATMGCPSGDKAENVFIRAIVGGEGAVIAAEAVGGPDGCRSAAVAAVRGLKLPRLVIDGLGIKTSRTIALTFHAGGTIEIHYGYGLDPLAELANFGSRTSRAGR